MPSKKNTAPQTFAPSLTATFKTLHKTFSDLIELKPWQLVHESVLLGVQHPDTGEVWYAYFMGELGEVVGFNLYNAINIAYWRYTLDLLQKQEEVFSPAIMLTHSFLQFTAGKKSAMPKEIVALHEAAGIVAPRGKPGYAEPVRYEAGYAPVIPGEHDLQLAGELIPGFISS